MHLYLIRHAESENNAKAEQQRVEDPAITSRGKRQASALADWLTTLRPDVVISSPFRRALQTAVPAMQRLDCSLEIWGDVFERGGCYRGWHAENYQGAEGLGHAEILQLTPTAILDPTLAPTGWWQCRPRERDKQASERAVAVKRRLEERLADREMRMVLITHAEFQRILLEQLLSEFGIDVASLGPICNAGVTHLKLQNAAWQLHWFNAVTHLPTELITDAKG
ncbi:histidine phosphatase family protein [Planctomycetaceae bacterium SH139]